MSAFLISMSGDIHNKYDAGGCCELSSGSASLLPVLFYRGCLAPVLMHYFSSFWFRNKKMRETSFVSWSSSSFPSVSAKKFRADSKQLAL